MNIRESAQGRQSHTWFSFVCRKKKHIQINIKNSVCSGFLEYISSSIIVPGFVCPLLANLIMLIILLFMYLWPVQSKFGKQDLSEIENRKH